MRCQLSSPVSRRIIQEIKLESTDSEILFALRPMIMATSLNKNRPDPFLNSHDGTMLQNLGRPGTYTGGGEAAPQMAAVRRRVLNATKAAGVRFLNACNENNVIDQLKDGVMICTGGDSPAADKGRAFSKRTDPW